MHGLAVLTALRSVVFIALIWKAIAHLKGEENPQYVLWVILHSHHLEGDALVSSGCAVWALRGVKNCLFGSFQAYSAQDKVEKDLSTGFILYSLW